MRELHSEAEPDGGRECLQGGIRQTVAILLRGNVGGGGLRVGEEEISPFIEPRNSPAAIPVGCTCKCLLQRFLQGRHGKAADLQTRLQNLIGGTRLLPDDQRGACGAATSREVRAVFNCPRRLRPRAGACLKESNDAAQRGRLNDCPFILFSPSPCGEVPSIKPPPVF